MEGGPPHGAQHLDAPDPCAHSCGRASEPSEPSTGLNNNFDDSVIPAPRSSDDARRVGAVGGPGGRGTMSMHETRLVVYRGRGVDDTKMTRPVRSASVS